jgi:hypothetical protein
VVLERIVAGLEKMSVEIIDDEWKVLFMLAFDWPQNSCFVGLDLLRLIVIHQEIPDNYQQGFMEKLLAYIPIESLETKFNKLQETNTMLTLRVIANLFSKDKSLHKLKSVMKTIFDKSVYISKCCSDNKNMQLALSTMIMNYSVMIDTSEDCLEVYGVVDKVIINLTDSESLFKVMVALGNVVVKYSEVGLKVKDNERLRLFMKKCNDGKNAVIVCEVFRRCGVE